MHYKKYKMFAIIFNNLKIFGSIDIVSFAVSYFCGFKGFIDDINK